MHSSLIPQTTQHHLNLTVVAFTRGLHEHFVLRVDCGHQLCDLVAELLHQFSGVRHDAIRQIIETRSRWSERGSAPLPCEFKRCTQWFLFSPTSMESCEQSRQVQSPLHTETTLPHWKQLLIELVAHVVQRHNITSGKVSPVLRPCPPTCDQHPCAACGHRHEELGTSCTLADAAESQASAAGFWRLIPPHSSSEDAHRQPQNLVMSFNQSPERSKVPREKIGTGRVSMQQRRHAMSSKKCSVIPIAIQQRLAAFSTGVLTPYVRDHLGCFAQCNLVTLGIRPPLQLQMWETGP